MQEFLKATRTAVSATLLLAVVCGGAYPALVFGLAQLLFPDQANGSLLRDAAGHVRGSSLIGQPFSGARYFHPRPSAAGQGYDAANSGGSNLGPTSEKLHDLVRDRLAAYRAENGLPENQAVPADVVTASASGLDPQISPRNAEIQAARVARARGLSLKTIDNLIQRHTNEGFLHVLGKPGVNVLTLNLALDRMSTGAAPK